jgi:DNA-binding transcriptional LysR family regulator
MKIDIRGLEAFLWIAELGTFRRAATHLNISQTAVSHRVSKFEEGLGLQLFTRTTRQVVLTKAGAEMLPVGRTLLADFDRQLQLIKARHVEHAEELPFACVPTLAVHLLPPVFAEFTRRRPKARVQVFDKTANEIGDMVAAGLAEFGVTLLGADRWNLAAHPLVKDEFLCVCPASHPLAKKPLINWRDLENKPLVRFTMPTVNRIVMDKALEKHSERLRWVYEVQHTMTALMLVQGGLALAAVPRLAAQNLPAGLKAVKLAGPKITRTIGIVRRRGEATSDLAGVFQNALKMHAATLST